MPRNYEVLHTLTIDPRKFGRAALAADISPAGLRRVGRSMESNSLGLAQLVEECTTTFKLNGRLVYKLPSFKQGAWLGYKLCAAAMESGAADIPRPKEWARFEAAVNYDFFGPKPITAEGGVASLYKIAKPAMGHLEIHDSLETVTGRLPAKSDSRFAYLGGAYSVVAIQIAHAQQQSGA